MLLELCDNDARILACAFDGSLKQVQRISSGKDR